MWSDEDAPPADGSAATRGMWSDSDVDDDRGPAEVAPLNSASAADKLRANATRARAAKRKKVGDAKAGLTALALTPNTVAGLARQARPPRSRHARRRGATG